MKKVFYLLAICSFIATSCNSDDSNPSIVDVPEPSVPNIGGTIAPNVGGPNQQNQVFVDLSGKTQTGVLRDSWDLGFSTGSDFRVVINGTVKMAVKELNTTNIDEVQTEDVTVSVGFSTFASSGYVDDPTGILTGTDLGQGTAIKQISSVDSDNKVYLVNMGFKVGTTTPNVGSVALDGEARGWMKIRVTRQGQNYVVQYAPINATSHQTVTVAKDASYNFVYLNLTSGQRVSVQPKKVDWDLSFTCFTNYLANQGTFITYYYADFIISNIHGGSKVYAVVTAAETLSSDYASFSIVNVDESKFSVSSDDQRVIGETWRNGGGPTFGPSIKDERFYVVKDAQNNLFKLRFLAITNDAGVRGNPVFEYELLK